MLGRICCQCVTPATYDTVTGCASVKVRYGDLADSLLARYRVAYICPLEVLEADDDAVKRREVLCALSLSGGRVEPDFLVEVHGGWRYMGCPWRDAEIRSLSDLALL